MASRQLLRGRGLIPALGGFTALKQEAADENTRVRQAGSHPGDDAQARFDAIEAEVDATYQAGKVRQPEPVPFSEALRAVMAGPHAEVAAPRQ